MIYTYQHNGQAYTIVLEPQADGMYRATIGERSYAVKVMPLSNNGWQLHYASLNEGRGSSHDIVYTAAQGDKRFISMNGQAYTLNIPDSRASRRKAAGGGGDLTAQMPGQVASVLVNTGDRVERGQTLVILEAMKMEIRVTAPTDGLVKRLLVEKGQVVERGQVLLEIEEKSDSA